MPKNNGYQLPKQIHWGIQSVQNLSNGERNELTNFTAGIEAVAADMIFQ